VVKSACGFPWDSGGLAFLNLQYLGWWAGLRSLLAKKHDDSSWDVTAAQLFDFVAALAQEQGRTMGQWHSGHLIGDFSHGRPPEKVHKFIMPGNGELLRGQDGTGNSLEWILEVHFVVPKREIGAYFGQLLTVA
jgi:hypothetical protein